MFNFSLSQKCQATFRYCFLVSGRILARDFLEDIYAGNSWMSNFFSYRNWVYIILISEEKLPSLKGKSMGSMTFTKLMTFILVSSISLKKSREKYLVSTFVGSILRIHGRKFEIVGTDRRVLSYLGKSNFEECFNKRVQYFSISQRMKL